MENPSLNLLIKALESEQHDYEMSRKNVETMTKNLNIQREFLATKRDNIESYSAAITVIQNKTSPDLIEELNQINKHTDYVQEVAAAMKAQSEGIQFLPNIIIIVEDDCQIEETKK